MGIISYTKLTPPTGSNSPLYMLHDIIYGDVQWCNNSLLASPFLFCFTQYVAYFC